jgi:23S rRNA pseudouridine1911/1915/1917 synthase
MPRRPRRPSSVDRTRPSSSGVPEAGDSALPPLQDSAPPPPVDAVEPEEAASADDVVEDEAALSEGPQRRVLVVRRELQTRLDVYLHQRLKGISRTRVQKLIDLGGVTIDGRVPKSSTTVHRGDKIDVILPPPAVRTIEPENIPLDILYEDDAFIVINKQADLIVHPARSHLTGTLVNALAQHFKSQIEKAGAAWGPWETSGFNSQAGGALGDERRAHSQHKPVVELALRSLGAGGSAKPGVPILRAHGQKRRRPEGEVPGLSRVGAVDLRPGIVHRLDKNTTGVMVVAKNDEAHWKIARQFEDRTPVKAYLAVAHGNFDLPGGVIDEPIGKHPTIREAYAVRHDSAGRRSVTIFRVREQYAGYSLVELELKTGRTHQIRVHLSFLGHPIVGDIIYGGEPVGPDEIENPAVPAGGRRFLTFARERAEGLRIEAQAQARAAAGAFVVAHPALHAAFLRFTHPFTREVVTFRAPMHGAMAAFVRALRPHTIDAPVAREGYWVDLAHALGD